MVRLLPSVVQLVVSAKRYPHAGSRPGVTATSTWLETVREIAPAAPVGFVCVPVPVSVQIFVPES